MTTTLLPALLGLATGLSLIIAIGAQNAWVLRVGIEGRSRLVLLVVVVCAASDGVLIAAGVVGIGAVVRAAPEALVVIRVIGAGFLVVYGLFAARRALRPARLLVANENRDVRMRTALVTTLALTWLNPHVYLDTVLFLGSVANQQGHGERWWWAAGALFGSCLWFTALGFGARLLRPVFARPAAWRILDAVIAVVMIGLGVRLALGA